MSGIFIGFFILGSLIACSFGHPLPISIGCLLLLVTLCNIIMHALCLLSPDQNLEAHGSYALTSIAASGTANIGHHLGHSLRRAMSMRNSTGSLPRRSRHRRSTKEKGDNRPSSLLSLNYSHMHSNSNNSVDPATFSPRNSGTFVDLRPVGYDPDSDTSSIVSSSSISTISSSNALDKTSQQAPQQLLHHLSSSHLAPDRLPSPRLQHRRIPSPLAYPSHLSGSPPLTHPCSSSPSSSSGLDSSHEA